jgi:predicted RecA/RadA family phage recombinase
MKNYIQPGDTLTLVAPYTRLAGEGAQIGAVFGVACNDVTSGADGEFQRVGVFDLTALSTATGAQGAKAYWDDGNKRVDTDGTVGMLIGALITAKTNGQTTARVVLNDGTPSTAEGPEGAIADLSGTLTGTVNGALVDVAATAGSCAGGATPAASDVDTAIATAVASIVGGVNEQNKEFQAKFNALLAALRAAGIIAT